MARGRHNELCRKTVQHTIAHSVKLRRENVACIEPNTCPNNPDLNRVHRRSFTFFKPPSPSPQTPPMIGWITPFGAAMQEWVIYGCWIIEDDDHAGVTVTRTATALHLSRHWIWETSFAVCRGSEWRTHWTRVSLTVCMTVKLLLLQTLRWNIFWSIA